VSVPGRASPGSATVALLIALVVAAVFAPALGNGFVNWDDDVNITDNPHFRGFAAANLRWMFTTPRMGHYVPLTWLTLALDHALWGMNPRGYHATSVLLHAANAALVFLVARRLLAGLPLAGPAFAALAFGLHPLRAESVAWVTERRDVLSGCFVLLAFLAYLRAAERVGRARTGWRAASLLAYAASLLSKAITMSFPLVLLIVDVYPLRRRALREKVPYVALAGLGAVLAIAALRTAAVTSWEAYGGTARFAMTVFNLAFYVSRTLVPVGLSPLYELPARIDPLAPAFALSLGLVAALTAAAVALRRRAPWLGAAWAAYVVMVLPVSGPVHAGLQIAHDRYSYLSCLPWALLAGAGVGLLVAARRRRAISAPVVAGAATAALALLVGWSYLTVQQVRIWRDSEFLWSAAVAAQPACSVCRGNLGRAYLAAGRIDAAANELQVGLALRPDRATLHNTLGAVRYRQRRYAESAAEFGLAARLRPGFAEPLNNLGVLEARVGDLDAAERHFASALKLQPDYVEARANLIRLMRQAPPR
jgi:tetratricopeptide (TPR) repeat protein